MTTHNDQLLRLDAFCREVQRDRGQGHLIRLPLHRIKKLLNLRTPRQAHHLLSILETEGLLLCVRRGVGHSADKPGCPSLWRYQGPLDP
jgi:hypothetical protein